MSKIQAILSGDIINSSALDSAPRTALENLLWAELGNMAGNKTDFSIDRGDAFQVKLALEGALEKGIALRCILKKTLQSDARIAIGIGKESLKGRNISSSDGEVYRLSGQGLDSLKESGVNLKIVTANEQWNKTWETVSYLLDEHITSWSYQQAEAVLLRLENKTYEEIARQLGINTSAAYKRLDSGHWKGIEHALKLFRYMIETTYSGL